MFWSIWQEEMNKVTARLEFKITDTKLYVLPVNLSKENDTKLLEQLKLGSKRTINKYRSNDYSTSK